MTYSVIESSVQDGRPVELFDFVRDGSHTRYASQSQDVPYAGDTYTASAISHDEIDQSNELAKLGLKVTFPRDDAFALGYVGTLHDAITTLTIRRGHLSDGDGQFEVIWKGRVVGGEINGAEITLTCESIFTSVRRMGLRARYQTTCRHALYGRGCNLDMADFATSATVTAASGVSLTVTEAALQADGFYNGGMVQTADGGLRFIMAHAGEQITLSRASDSILADVTDLGTASITLYPGCAHDTAACDGTFNNLANFGGFPYIPWKNPMGGSSIV